MSDRRKIDAETWYQVNKCWTSVGDVNDEMDESKVLGIVATKKEALDLCKKHGLSAMSWEQFNRTNQPAFGLIEEIFVVFPDKSRTKGRIVSDEIVELTSALEARRQKIVDAAARSGIPAEVIDLTKVR